MMRLGLQVLLLAALTAFLALQVPGWLFFPSSAKQRSAAQRPPSVSYVELGAEEYANRIRLARMAWQVRAHAAGWIDLEEGTPLAWEVLPPPAPAHGVPPMPSPPCVSPEPAQSPSLAPPSVAAPPAENLPPLKDRRRDSLLDLSPYDSLLPIN